MVSMAVAVGGAAAAGALAGVPRRIPAAGVRLIVAAVLVEGHLLVEDAALFGALAAEGLVVHGPLLPRHLLRPPLQPQHQRLRRRRRSRGGGGGGRGGVDGHGHGSG